MLGEPHEFISLVYAFKVAITAVLPFVQIRDGEIVDSLHKTAYLKYPIYSTSINRN